MAKPTIFLPTGFTLIELLLAVAIIGILTMVTAPLLISAQTGNEIDVATNVLAQDLYRAQSFSRNERRDISWGVARSGQNIILFAGQNYASRLSGLDQTYNVPSSTTLTGPSEIDYGKLTGLPLTTASFTLSSGGKSRSLTLNAKGMVEY